MTITTNLCLVSLIAHLNSANLSNEFLNGITSEAISFADNSIQINIGWSEY